VVDQWRKPSDLPERIELIDNVTKLPIAEITSMGRDYKWTRKTSALLHGAPPAEGIARGLAEAKTHVLDGLPSE
jgi:hypothetical protein